MTLRAVRHLKEERVVWADAVCIDQNNIQEKASQIPLMGSIYRNAAEVLVWLGPQSDHAMDMIENIGGRAITAVDPPGLMAFYGQPPLRMYSAQDWSAVDDLLQRPWWFRVWTHQEIVLARKATMLCGNRRLDWNFFTLLRRGVERYIDELARSMHPDLQRAIRNTIDMCSVISFKQQHRLLLKNNDFVLPIDALGHLILETGHLEATHEHDRLYGLYGLIDHGDLPKPDYGMDLLQVHIEIAYFLMKSSPNLNHLKQSGNGLGVTSTFPGAPSWLVWNRNVALPDSKPAFPLISTKYNASAGYDGKIELEKDGRTIKVETLFRTTIECLRRFDDNDGTPKLSKACRHFAAPPYIDQENPFCSKIAFTALAEAFKNSASMVQDAHLSYPTTYGIFSRVFDTDVLRKYPTGISMAEALFRTYLADIDESGALLEPENEFANDNALLEPHNDSTSLLGRRLSMARKTPAQPSMISWQGKDGRYFMDLDENHRPVHRYQSIFDQAGVSFTTWRILTESFLIDEKWLALKHSWLAFRGIEDGKYPFDPFRSTEMQQVILLRPFYKALYRATRNRQLLYTTEGYLGLAPQGAIPGDEITVIAGCEAPLVLRREGDYYIVVGECFVQGLMRGELKEKIKNGNVNRKEIRLQ